MRIAALLFAVMALVACSPQVKGPEEPKPHATLVFEIDADDLRATQLNELSMSVREELRKAPLIAILPGGRTVEGDHLSVRLAEPSGQQDAMARIAAIGEAEDWPDPVIVGAQGDGSLDVKLGEKTFQKMQADVLPEVLDVAKRRLDGIGLQSAIVQPKGANQIEVQVPADADPKSITDLLTRSGVLTFNLVDADANIADYEIGVEVNGRFALPDDGAGGALVIYTDAVLRGADLSGARPGLDDGARPNIQFQLHPGGAAKLGRATTQNIGKQFAIVLDGRIVSAPVIHSAITGGSGQITGDFTVEEAERIAVTLRTGALPVKLKLIESSGFKDAQ